jgi:hypothetical protein
MGRTHLSQEYSDYLAVQVQSSTFLLSHALTDRIAERLWLIAPEARAISVSLNQTTGRYELVEVRDEKGEFLYRLGDEGVLNSLAYEDAVTRSGALIDNDVAALGVTLAISPLPLRSSPSKDYQYGWDVDLPLTTRRLQFPGESE